jgi:hypothetical protein
MQTKKFSEPFVNSFNYKTLHAQPGITNCEMEYIFPDIVDDPLYGLNLSSPRNSKLQGFYAGEILKRADKSVYEIGAVDNCYGNIPKTPYWNFISVNGLLTGRDPLDQKTNFTLLVQYGGWKFPVKSSLETLKMDQQYPYTAYILIKNDQINEIGSIQLSFSRAN